ncbi:flippase [Candidatus Bathyarchaeota archaeon]|nr:flippase [Candidatus Bathyarchaeota archaeon]
MEDSDAGIVSARGASYLLFQGLVTNLANVVYFAFAARLLPTLADVGRVSTLALLVVLFTTAGSLAIPAAVTKFISYLDMGKYRDVNGVFKLNLKAGTLLSLLAAAACFISSGPIASYLLGSEDYTILLQLLSLDVFLSTLYPFFIASLQGIQRFGDIAKVGIVTALIRNTVAIFGLISGHGMFGVIAGWTLGDVSAALYALFLSARAFTGGANRQDLKPLMSFSFPLYVSQLLTYAIGTVDRYLVVILASQAALGIYNPAVAATGVLALVTTSIGNVLFPMMSKRRGTSGNESLKDVSKVASKYVFLAYVPMALGMAATAEPTMIFFVGEQFSAGALPLAILAVAAACSGATIIINNILLAEGRTSVFTFASLISLVADVALSFLLIGSLGSVGAALARSSTIIISLVFPLLFLGEPAQKYLDSRVFAKALLASCVMALAVWGIESIRMSKYLLPVYVGVGLIVYMGMIKILKVVSKEDFNFARAFVPQKMKRIINLAERVLV